ncbi:hypothetical protein ERO13_D13G088250v2 [Gossypium hirsutum]|uniref:Uncharacterized protein n=3 Tax=Gossypium TaxID=3633 RepID=A0A5J5NJJ9_GOSBA|nr:hypothetical protein ES319_D13G099400v1 [Gossypium barbadense]KAG4111131.1 hypothetical protein ERO13_D13G088250v2 [Gossypium hirsutum]TYH34103.1 hypothetical protein ES332_D13G105900v1 [Gossypium tomentosum]TYI46362.1 hypothetical protein E1A91_D13G102300v1 [Gossypium mustelinum]
MLQHLQFTLTDHWQHRRSPLYLFFHFLYFFSLFSSFLSFFVFQKTLVVVHYCVVRAANCCYFLDGCTIVQVVFSDH